MIENSKIQCFASKNNQNISMKAVHAKCQATIKIMVKLKKKKLRSSACNKIAQRRLSVGIGKELRLKKGFLLS